MKIKKFLPNLLCASMIFSNVMTAFATTTETDISIYENMSEDDSKQTEVLYNESASYFVTIPKTISLGNDKQSTYSVKVEGDIPSDKQVYVSPIDSLLDTDEFDFYMKDQSKKNPKANVVATVTQSKFYWDFEEVSKAYEETNNKVTSENLTAGSWRGTFDFEINLRTNSSHTPPIHSHSYIETIAKESTCTEEGLKTLTCNCGDSYTAAIPMKVHNYGEDDKCEVCGTLSSEHTHNYTEAITKEATCTETGSKTLTCNCGDVKTEVIPATGHNYIEQVTKDATCTEAGEKTLTCTCGEVTTETIPATGHDYESGSCTNCGEKEATLVRVRANGISSDDVFGSLSAYSNGVLDKQIKRSNVMAISILNSANGHYLSDTNCWDVSDAQDGSVLAWYQLLVSETTNYSTGQKYPNGYVIYIAPKEAGVKLQAPVDASYLFYIGCNVYREDYSYRMYYPMTINQINKMDFSCTKKMDHMLQGVTGDLNLDIDTSSLTSASDMCASITYFKKDGSTRDSTLLNSVSFGDKVDFSKVINTYNMFCGQSNLTSVSLPSTLKAIGNGMFQACNKLKTVSAVGVTNIGQSSFDGCTSLTSLSAPNVEHIDSYAFTDCTSLPLTGVDFWGSVDYIWLKAFEGCTAFTGDLHLDNITTVGMAAFLNTNINDVYLGNKATSVGKNAFKTITGTIYTVNDVDISEAK